MSWEMVRLGDVLDISRGGSPRPIENFITEDANGLNWIKIGDVKEGEKFITKTNQKIKPCGLSKTREVSPNDFLLSNSMSYGRPFITKISGCIHDGWLMLRDRDNRFSQDYLYHVLTSTAVKDQFSKYASGAVVKNLNTDAVSKVTIPLPPISEQKRIAAILDKADEIRRKREQAIAKLEQLAQSIFVEMFGNPVTNNKGWDESKKLSDVADIVSGITKGRKISNTFVRDVPYLAVLNVQDKHLNLSVVKTIQASTTEINRYLIKKNDLLLTEGGDPDKLGRGTLWNNELPECIHQNHIFRVRLIEDDLSPRFLNWLIGSARGKKYFLKSAKQTTGIASINMTQLKSFPLIIPPLALQEEFAKRINQIEKLKADNTKALDNHNSLFASLQQQAFSGNL